MTIAPEQVEKLFADALLEQRQQTLIWAMVHFLETFMEREDVTAKDIGWITDDIDEVLIRYFNEVPDGDRQEEIFSQSTGPLTFLEALELLQTRINNTLA